MERKQFTFYRSFYEAVNLLPKKEQAAVLLAICAYALDGKEPSLSGTSAAIFSLVKPNLDASKRKAESGKNGGANRKQTESKTEANGKQTESKTEANRKRESEKEKENEIENEIEVEVENECYKGNTLGTVMTAYLEKVNPMASKSCLDELKGFVEEMGSECCLRAIDIALDAKKTSWSYIRAILRDKLSNGVKCLADWDALEEKRAAKKGKPSADGKRTVSDFELEAVRKLMGN